MPCIRIYICIPIFVFFFAEQANSNSFYALAYVRFIQPRDKRICLKWNDKNENSLSVLLRSIEPDDERRISIRNSSVLYFSIVALKIQRLTSAILSNKMHFFPHFYFFFFFRLLLYTVYVMTYECMTHRRSVCMCDATNSCNHLDGKVATQWFCGTSKIIN